MPLTDTEIRKIKATGKDFQKADVKVLVIRKAGGKFWRGEFRLEGIGIYTTIKESSALFLAKRQAPQGNSNPALHAWNETPISQPITRD